MSSFYVDSSALVKVHLPELGSGWMQQLVNAVDAQGRYLHSIYTATVSVVEVAAAITAAERTGALLRRQRDLALDEVHDLFTHRYFLIPVRTDVLDEAIRLTADHPLRGYDAIQLAAALGVSRQIARLQRSLVFVTGDERLLTAADSEGLTTENPFDHTDLDAKVLSEAALTRAVVQMGEKGDRRAVPVLVACLSHSSDSLRRQAAAALGKLGDVTAVSALESSLSDPEPRVRQHAAIALGQIGDEAAVSALEGLARGDPEKEVRAAAEEAAKQLRED